MKKILIILVTLLLIILSLSPAYAVDVEGITIIGDSKKTVQAGAEAEDVFYVFNEHKSPVDLFIYQIKTFPKIDPISKKAEYYPVSDGVIYDRGLDILNLPEKKSPIKITLQPGQKYEVRFKGKMPNHASGTYSAGIYVAQPLGGNTFFSQRINVLWSIGDKNNKLIYNFKDISLGNIVIKQKGIESKIINSLPIDIETDIINKGNVIVPFRGMVYVYRGNKKIGEAELVLHDSKVWNNNGKFLEVVPTSDPRKLKARIETLKESLSAGEYKVVINVEYDGKKITKEKTFWSDVVNNQKTVDMTKYIVVGISIFMFSIIIILLLIYLIKRNKEEKKLKNLRGEGVKI